MYACRLLAAIDGLPQLVYACSTHAESLAYTLPQTCLLRVCGTLAATATCCTLAAHLPRACRHCRLQCTCSALTASSLAAHLPRACREGQMRLTCDVLAAGYTCSPCAVCLPQLCWQCACGKHTAYTHAVHMRNHLRRNPAANGPQVSPKYPTC